MAQPFSQYPLVIPAGWVAMPEERGLKMIMTQTASGLRVSFAIESYPGGGSRDTYGPTERVGTFRRMVLSRKTHYPTWDEMRDFIRTCGLFDRTRDVMMVIPPDTEYVNLHPHAFHWWQQVEE